MIPLRGIGLWDGAICPTRIYPPRGKIQTTGIVMIDRIISDGTPSGFNYCRNEKTKKTSISVGDQ